MLRRVLLAAALLAVAAAWAGYWANRFFEDRRAAEAALDKLQRLLARGFFDPILSAQVDVALAASHRALAAALAGPALMLIGVFAALWFLARRPER